jgi:hypothetical protein
MDNAGEPGWVTALVALASIVSVLLGVWQGAWLTLRYAERQSQADRAWELVKDLSSAEADFDGYLHDYTAARAAGAQAGMPPVDLVYRQRDRLIAVLRRASYLSHLYPDDSALAAVEERLRSLGSALTTGWAFGRSLTDSADRERKRAQIMADFNGLRPEFRAIAKSIAQSAERPSGRRWKPGGSNGQAGRDR